jgi:hypothetical protein
MIGNYTPLFTHSPTNTLYTAHWRMGVGEYEMRPLVEGVGR